MESIGPIGRVACVAAAVLAVAPAMQGATILFQDNFSTQGTKLNTAAWTTEIGPPSFLGRTQLADWITPGGIGQFVVGADGAHLTLDTNNPTDPNGTSLYGTHGKTLQSFAPTPATAIEFSTMLQLTSIQPGIVYGMYLYGCAPALCASQHDEIDIEVLTNLLQPGSAPQVNLNRYASEPLGAGHATIVNLPGGFNALAAHLWTVRWSLSRLDFFVDGTLISSATDHVPQGAMQVNEIAWGPASDWLAAYSASLQPVGSPAQNHAYTALMTSVTVSQVAVPEGATFVLAGAGLLAFGLLSRRRSSRRSAAGSAR